MTTEQFAYWLQGYAEVHGAPPSAEQWAMIKEHLQTCFLKVTGQSSSVQVVTRITQPSDMPDWLKRQSQISNPVAPYTVTC